MIELDEKRCQRGNPCEVRFSKLPPGRNPTWNLSDPSIINHQYFCAINSSICSGIIWDIMTFFLTTSWLQIMGVKKCSSANICKTPDIPWSQVFNIRFSCRKLSLGIVDDGHPPGAKVNTRDGTRNFCWGYWQILLRILTNTRGLLDKWQTLLMTLTGGASKMCSQNPKCQIWGERGFWEGALLLTTGSLNVLLLQGTSCTCTCNCWLFF